LEQLVEVFGDQGRGEGVASCRDLQAMSQGSSEGAKEFSFLTSHQLHK